MQRAASGVAVHQGVPLVNPCGTSTCWINDHAQMIVKVCKGGGRLGGEGVPR